MFDLVIVMPIYNEEECIAKVIKDWDNMLSSLHISYQILAINDGSTDGTLKELKSLNIKSCQVVDKANSGHGPTILYGYKLAIDKKASWIFQCDSDDEMEAGHFPLVWNMRENVDAVIGKRENREQSIIRSFVSKVSRLSIGIIYKRGVRDVNAPYRLISIKAFEKILPCIPEKTFAPNIVISGLLALYEYKIENIDIPHICRTTGTVSLTDLNILKVGLEALKQTINIRLRLNTTTT